MGVEFRILGPLEVRVDDVAVALGGPRQRALLATLLLSANRVVSRDRLIDELSGGRDGSDHNLRVQVSRLRKALGANDGLEERLLARPPGYLLRVEQGELDLAVFEHRLSEGRAALEERDFEHAAVTLCEAESLWRGRPLADLAFEPFARIEVERLEELRLVAAEERIEAELALGRHAVLVAELEAKVAEHPLRERLRGQLMLALYRCGRQADALEVYRAGRVLMSEELALEPGRALRVLEGSILRQEPELDLSLHDAISVRVELADGQRPPPHDPPIEQVLTVAPAAGRGRRVTFGVIAFAVVVAAAVAVVTGLTSGGERTLAATANSVAVIDMRQGGLGAVVGVGGPPGGIAAGAGAVWATDTADDLLLELDRAGRIVERIPVGHGPEGVAVGDGDVWVVDQLDRTVAEINPRAVRQVATFAVGTGAGPIVFGDGSLWVANTVDDTISRINPAAGTVSTIALAGSPAGIAVGPDGVWVTSASTGQLLLIDPQSDQVTQAVDIGSGPTGVAAGGGSVWVADTPEGTLVRFDPGSGVVTNLNVGTAPVGVAYGAGAVWIANALDGTVARVDPSSGAIARVRVGDEPTALTTSGDQVWTTVAPAPASHRGGTLRAVEEPPVSSFGSSVDPAVWAGVVQWQMLSLTNDGLVTYRRVGGLGGSALVPDLATALPAPTDNGLTYTFRLRSGIHYSTGAPVRPEDFRREIERVMLLGNGYPQGFYVGIVGAERCLRATDLHGFRPAGRRCELRRGIVADDAAHTVTFHLTTPDPDFLYKLAFPWADAVPAGAPDRDLRLSPLPATGPYMTQSISASHATGPDGHPVAFHTWTVVRNPRFHPWSAQAQPDGYPDRIVVTDDTNPGLAVDEVEHSRIDVLLPAPASSIQTLEVRYTSQLHSDPAAFTFAFALNTRASPFNHLAVRRALNYAIDRARIVNLAGGPLNARVTCQILPPNISGYRPYCPYTLAPNASGAWDAPNLAKARQLVRASGTRGAKVTVIVQPADATNPTTTVGRYVASVLDDLGYRTSVRVVADPYSTAGDSRNHAQIAWLNWGADYDAPSDFINPLFTCRSFVRDSTQNLNEAEFCDPRIDAQVKRASALQASTPGAATQAWARIDHELTNQAPWLPLYNFRTVTATSARLGNYQYHPFWDVLLDQLWVR